MYRYLFPGESIVEPILSTFSSSCQLLILFHISTSVALEKLSLTSQMRFGLLKDAFTAPEFFTALCTLVSYLRGGMVSIVFTSVSPVPRMIGKQ